MGWAGEGSFCLVFISTDDQKKLCWSNRVTGSRFCEDHSWVSRPNECEGTRQVHWPWPWSSAAGRIPGNFFTYLKNTLLVALLSAESQSRSLLPSDIYATFIPAWGRVQVWKASLGVGAFIINISNIHAYIHIYVCLLVFSFCLGRLAHQLKKWDFSVTGWVWDNAKDQRPTCACAEAVWYACDALPCTFWGRIHCLLNLTILWKKGNTHEVLVRAINV